MAQSIRLKSTPLCIVLDQCTTMSHYTGWDSQALMLIRVNPPRQFPPSGHAVDMLMKHAVYDSPDGLAGGSPKMYGAGAAADGAKTYNTAGMVHVGTSPH